MGVFLVMIALIWQARGKGMLRDPLFISLITRWILIYLTILITGYWIEFHETFYGAAGALPNVPAPLLILIT
jgi:hypothetical protein